MGARFGKGYETGFDEFITLKTAQIAPYGMNEASTAHLPYVVRRPSLQPPRLSVNQTAALIRLF
jgi:hypothetical protein